MTIQENIRIAVIILAAVLASSVPQFFTSAEDDAISKDLFVVCLSKRADKDGYILFEIKNKTENAIVIMSTKDGVAEAIIGMPEFYLLEFDNEFRWYPRPFRRGSYQKSTHKVILEPSETRKFRYFYDEFKRSRKHRLRDNERGNTYKVTMSVRTGKQNH